mmetsp:Transcript_65725/g.169144  ORF Transcript_65725/g.169144 Transcript_65725/m.169144 type:complete len:290 (+) Transcript_65725:903-1772(+)
MKTRPPTMEYSGAASKPSMRGTNHRSGRTSTSTSTSEPSLQTRTRTESCPASRCVTRCRKWIRSLSRSGTVPSCPSSTPSSAMMTSFTWSLPAAGPRGQTAATRTPPVESSLKPRRLRRGLDSNVWTRPIPREATPRYFAGASTQERNCSSTAVGITYPIFDAFFRWLQATPTTSPFVPSTGPPELPGLIAASIWKRRRPSPFTSMRDTTPRVTEMFSPPTGNPIHVTLSSRRGNSRDRSRLSFPVQKPPSTESTARSQGRPTQTTRALYLIGGPLVARTSTETARWTT